jgi:Bacterial protein of unknown function (DUF922)
MEPRSGLLRLVVCLLWSLTGHPVIAEGCGPVEDAERASHRRLAWADFQAPPPPKERRDRADRTAVRLRTSLRIDSLAIATRRDASGAYVAHVESPCVRAYVLKQLSGRLASADRAEQLAHEQGHFDLTELHARRLERRISELRASSSSAALAERALREAVRTAYAERSASHEREQARYDQSTQHGQQHRWQTKWAKRIAERLAFSGSEQVTVAAR